MEEDDECPICLREYSRDDYILKDSNSNHEIESSCNHWFCCGCLESLYINNIYKCPLCRVDITELVMTYENNNDDENDDANENENEHDNDDEIDDENNNDENENDDENDE
jgi:hypothetical protein